MLNLSWLYRLYCKIIIRTNISNVGWSEKKLYSANFKTRKPFFILGQYFDLETVLGFFKWIVSSYYLSVCHNKILNYTIFTIKVLFREEYYTLVTGDWWHVICDMWHITCVMWHMTCDRYVYKLFGVCATIHIHWEIQCITLHIGKTVFLFPNYNQFKKDFTVKLWTQAFDQIYIINILKPIWY